MVLSWQYRVNHVAEEQVVANFSILECYIYSKVNNIEQMLTIVILQTHNPREHIQWFESSWSQFIGSYVVVSSWLRIVQEISHNLLFIKIALYNNQILSSEREGKMKKKIVQRSKSTIYKKTKTKKHK